MSSKDMVTYEVKDNIAVICFNNPPHNIANAESTGQLINAVGKIEKDSSVRVVVFCANGRSYGAGSDMEEIIHYINEGTYVSVKMARAISLVNRIANLPIPTICALDAPAYQGSVERLLACDMIIASENASLTMTGVDIGSFPGCGGVPRLVQAIGARKTMEFLLFGSKMTAQQAYDCGLINAIAKDCSAYDMAMEWAKNIAAKHPMGPRAIKKAISGIFKPQLEYLTELQQGISQEVMECGSLKQSCEEFFAKREAKKKAAQASAK